MVCLAQEQSTLSIECRNAIAKNRVSARKSANPKALFWCFATVLVKDYFEGDALVGVLTS